MNNTGNFKISFIKKISLPKSFYLIAVGDMFSRIGDNIYQLAIPLYVLYLTNSSIWMGASFAIQQCSVFITGLIFGAVVDRNNPKKIVLINSIVQTLFICLLLILHFEGIRNIYLIIFISFLLTGSGFLYKTAINSLLPNIVSKENLPMASAQFSFTKSLAKIIGPSIAGFLISVLSPIHSLWIDAVSFFIIFVCMFFIKDKKEPDSAQREEKSDRKLAGDIMSGFKYIFSSGYVRSLVFFNFLLNFGYVLMISMFVMHLKETLNLNPKDIGIIYSTDGIGTIVAGLFLPVLMKKFKNGKLILTSSFVLGISVFLLGYISNAFAIGALFCIVMYSGQIINITMFTFWQMNIPIDKLGRVYSLATMMEGISVPISGLLSGIILNYYGSFFLMKLSGIIITIVTLVFLLFSNISRIDNRNLIQ